MTQGRGGDRQCLNATLQQRFSKACARSVNTEPASAPSERSISNLGRFPDPAGRDPQDSRKSRYVQAVFAHMIRVPVRTMEGWEQGRSNPPDSATALILMAQKYPDTFERLASL